MKQKQVKLKFKLVHGSGCGSLGRAVASDTRGPRIKSSHWRKNYSFNHYQLDWKDKNKEKRDREWHIFIKFKLHVPTWRDGQMVCSIFDKEFHNHVMEVPCTNSTKVQVFGIRSHCSRWLMAGKAKTSTICNESCYWCKVTLFHFFCPFCGSDSIQFVYLFWTPKDEIFNETRIFQLKFYHEQCDQMME